MICGEHLLDATGRGVALCKRAPHEDEWHEAFGVYVDHQTKMVDIRWRDSKEE